MNTKLIIDIAINLIRARLKQSVIAAVGVTFGIAMFITLLGFMNGLNNLLDGLMLNRTPHVRLYNEVKPSPDQPVLISKEYKGNTNFIQSIKPKGFGVIVRTVAEGKNTAEIEKDLQNLINRWTAMCKRLATAHHPSKVLGELNKASSILRDVFNDTFTGIQIDDEELYQETKDYLAEIAPEKQKIVKFYQSKDVPLFEKYHIERQIKTSFGKTVSMSKGAYLIIEHTEALHVIDVNSGNNISSTSKEHALNVNRMAATEIARQLRLRDMGGIIVVDFIDMHNADNRKLLYDKLKEEMRSDRAKHNILPPSKFGLIQITRQRLRPEVNVEVLEACASCGGSGKAQPSILFVEQIENALRFIVKEQAAKDITLCVHPYIEGYLKQKGFLRSIQWKWYFEYKQWIKITKSDSYSFMEYHFLNKDLDEIVF